MISKRTFQQFAALSGLFAASRLLVEIAIPTALVIASENLVTESSLDLKGRAYWGTEINGLGAFDWNLEKSLSEFPSSQLYVHPVKLSK